MSYFAIGKFKDFKNVIYVIYSKFSEFWNSMDIGIDIDISILDNSVWI